MWETYKYTSIRVPISYHTKSTTCYVLFCSKSDHLFSVYHKLSMCWSVSYTIVLDPCSSIMLWGFSLFSSPRAGKGGLRRDDATSAEGTFAKGGAEIRPGLWTPAAAFSLSGWLLCCCLFFQLTDPFLDCLSCLSLLACTNKEDGLIFSAKWQIKSMSSLKPFIRNQDVSQGCCSPKHFFTWS